MSLGSAGPERKTGLYSPRMEETMHRRVLIAVAFASSISACSGSAPPPVSHPQAPSTADNEPVTAPQNESPPAPTCDSGALASVQQTLEGSMHHVTYDGEVAAS